MTCLVLVGGVLNLCEAPSQRSSGDTVSRHSEGVRTHSRAETESVSATSRLPWQVPNGSIPYQAPGSSHRRAGRNVRATEISSWQSYHPDDIKADLDVVYAERPGTDSKFLSLDIYRPKKSPGKLPVIIMIHGGGWRIGDKSNLAVGLDKAKYFNRKDLFMSPSIID